MNQALAGTAGGDWQSVDVRATDFNCTVYTLRHTPVKNG